MQSCKVTYFTATEIQCVTVSTPVFLTKLNIESLISINTLSNPIFKLDSIWKPDRKTFVNEGDGFYSIRFSSEPYAVLFTFLNSVSRYSTELVIVYYK